MSGCVFKCVALWEQAWQPETEGKTEVHLMSADRHDDAAVWATDWRDGRRRGESQTHYTEVLSMHLCKFCRHPTHSDGFTDRSYVGSDESRQVYQCIYTCYGRTEELCEKGLLPCKYHQPHVVGRQKEVWSHGYLHTASPAGDQPKRESTELNVVYELVLTEDLCGKYILQPNVWESEHHRLFWPEPVPTCAKWITRERNHSGSWVLAALSTRYHRVLGSLGVNNSLDMKVTLFCHVRFPGNPGSYLIQDRVIRARHYVVVSHLLWIKEIKSSRICRPRKWTTLQWTSGKRLDLWSEVGKRR